MEPIKEAMELTLEQQFQLRSFETQVKRMSESQAKEFLVKLYQQMMVQQTMYLYFIRHKWGIGGPETPNETPETK